MTKYNEDTLYTIIYLDYVKELKNIGVDVEPEYIDAKHKIIEVEQKND